VEFGNLHAVDYFDLKNYTRLEKVPNSMTKLPNLKIMSFNGCENLIQLPVEFSSLHALDYLDVEICVGLEKLLDSFTKFATLKTLCF
jgi:hypothetical protein